jgi:hypothetical protein
VSKDWLLRAAMLGAVVNGDDAAVSGIDNELGRHIAGRTATLAYRSYMLAIAARHAAEQKSASPGTAAGR